MQLNLSKSGNVEYDINDIVLWFDNQISSSIAEKRVEYQIDWKTVNTYFYVYIPFSRQPDL